jgi:uncharacterized PurR-regulated membrane protein YhhQ (DUF165 family)
MKQYRFFDLIMAVFVTVLVVSNIASSAKIVDWGFSFFGVRMAFDAGTIVGELVDTVVFVVLASAFGVFPWSLFLTLTLTNYVFKCGVEALMTPVTYAVVNGLKRVEAEDYYDRSTNFNPFVA